MKPFECTHEFGEVFCLHCGISRSEYIAVLEAHSEHDEDNLEGLQHALVRANLRYTQAEAALAECRQYKGWTQFVAQRSRACRAEAALAERDYFIDSLHSESGIPTRHWRDTITQCVADLRTHAKTVAHF